jgi:UDP-N-acetylmuramyl pentapeptide phosphotransferase/UDP-N-acetylglucosamine-1-phosphate transferase
LSFLAAFYVLPSLIRISNHYGIHDLPDERKLHKTPVPFLGGVAIFFAFHLIRHINLSPVIQSPVYYEFIAFFIAANFFIGLSDDFFDFSPRRKFLIQFIISSGLIYVTELTLPFDQILPILSYVPFSNNFLTFIVLIAIINAINMIDGLDGLAATLVLISAGVYALLFFIEDNFYFLSMAISIAGALIGFLFYNRPKAMIYMGDSGSFLIGSIIATFTLIFIANGNQEIMSVNNRFQIGYAIVAIPGLDLVRLFICRMAQKRSPFFGDNRHLHHLLQNKGFGVKQTLATIILLQLIILIAAVLFQGAETFFPFLLTTAAAYAGLYWFLKS